MKKIFTYLKWTIIGGFIYNEKDRNLEVIGYYDSNCEENV